MDFEDRCRDTLTTANSVAVAGAHAFLWSLQVTPAANFLYAAGGPGSAQIYGFSVGADGSRTLLGTQMVQTNSFDCGDLSHSPDGKFFYATDDHEVVHALASAE